MFGRWNAIGVSFVLAAVAFGCGGAVERNRDEVGSSGSGGASSRAGAEARGGAVTGGRANTAGAPPSAGAGGSRPPSGGAGGEGVPIDSGCTPEDLPPPTMECDAFSGLGECGPGMACYPFVEHPGGDGCEAQVYGTWCSPAGVGTQGARCGDDTGDWCAAGHVCVIGQRPGKRCAALCTSRDPNACTDGLLCGDLDVAGFGVCG